MAKDTPPKPNCRGETFKAGDKVRVLGGDKLPDPLEIGWTHPMNDLIGHTGQVESIHHRRGGHMIRVCIRLGSFSRPTHWYDPNWIERTDEAFDIDTFAKYLKTPPRTPPNEN